MSKNFAIPGSGHFIWAGVVLVSLATGCGGGNGGMSDYERHHQEKMSLTDSLKAQGARKVEIHSYPPYGEAYIVDLSGAKITDELMENLKQLEKLSELNLSRSTLTDADLAKLNAASLLGYTMKLDLSHTAVTSAGLDGLTNTLAGLTDLNLAGTKDTQAGAERLKKRRSADKNIPAQFRTTRVRF
jgi:hypothetical protein